MPESHAMHRKAESALQKNRAFARWHASQGLGIDSKTETNNQATKKPSNQEIKQPSNQATKQSSNQEIKQPSNQEIKQ